MWKQKRPKYLISNLGLGLFSYKKSAKQLDSACAKDLCFNATLYLTKLTNCLSEAYYKCQLLFALKNFPVDDTELESKLHTLI